MPRAVWTGSLSFGLVNVGVRLFPATSPKDVRFHLVDERGQRVRFRRFVPDEPAEPEEMADLILFLASPRNRFMVGETVIANGGLWMV